jgi:Ca2+-binding RTX toxin-like protein
MMWSSGKAKVSVLALSAGLLTAVIATTGSNAGSSPRCDGKRATIVRGSGDGDIFGTAGADVIVARGGDDFIGAGAGRDRVCAGRGNDIVYGEEGSDPHLSGGRGRDFVVGPSLTPGSDGDDYVRGGRGDDSGVFNFRGRPGPTGGLVGGPGDDKLDGGRGRDRCEGGTGQDQRRKCEL